MSGHLPFVNILRLHKSLISRLILFDLILGVSGAIFLLIPLDIFALSLSNLSLFVLFIFLTVVYQIHLFRTYSGGVSFYLILPIKKYFFLIILFIDTMVPIILSLLISMIVFAFANISQLMLFDNRWIDRFFDIVLFFFILKTITLPILVLYKKHVMLILFFMGLLAVIYGLI